MVESLKARYPVDLLEVLESDLAEAGMAPLAIKRWMNKMVPTLKTSLADDGPTFLCAPPPDMRDMSGEDQIERWLTQ
jgi:hypothetical protein